MTEEKAINILADGDWWNYLDNFTAIESKSRKKFLDALDTALAALRAKQELEKNAPLTLDELREMDGEPVYIRMEDGREGYAIIVWAYDSPLLYGPDYYDGVSGEPDIDFYGLQDANDSLKESNWNLHQLGWLAYRHKPKEVTT